MFLKKILTDNPEVKNIVYRIVEDMVDRQIRMNNDIVPEGHLDTTTALIYDSVNAFALALNELTSVQQVIPSNLDCDEHRTWSHGNSLMNYMKVVDMVNRFSTYCLFLDGGVCWSYRPHQV